MAQTLKGRKVYVCATPQPTDLNQAGYEGLTWVEIGHVGSIGESGTNTNIVSYDELGTDVTQKNKGISNAGDPQIEVARLDTDAGQDVMRAAALTKNIYAIKMVDDDAAAGYVGTTYYNRGLVAGPTRPNGRNEDFNLEHYTLGCVQLEIVVEPQSLSVPTNSFRPSISGLADASGEILTAIEGTWTGLPTSYLYQWQKDTLGNNTYVDISGATSKTYDPVVGEIGSSIRVGVKGVNSTGPAAAFAYSGGTSLVVA